MRLESLTILLALFYCLTAIRFRLVRNKETCIHIPTPDQYHFEYMVFGESPENIQCVINDGPKIIVQKRGIAHFRQALEITSSDSKICFSGLDTHPKSVSFELIQKNDPMGRQILEKDLSKMESMLKQTYFSMEKVYANQHFYYERNRSQKQKLGDLEKKVKVMKALKAIFLIIAGIAQYFLIRKFLSKSSKVGEIREESDRLLRF